MTRIELMTAVSKLYDAACGNVDNVVLKYATAPEGDHGDTLAQFIVRELDDNFDSDAYALDQLYQANRALEIAAGRIGAVADELKELLGISREHESEAKRA